MNIFIVYAHPEPKSFNKALFHAAIDTFRSNGHQVEYSDLYEMQFDPVSDRSNFTTTLNPNYFKQQLEETHATANNGFSPNLATEQEKLERCDIMIWQFPLWWFTVPGILKGWVDRVFAMGRVYGQGRTYKTGVNKGKRALMSLTTGGIEDHYIEGGNNGDIYGILRPIHRGMLEFTGFSVLAPHIIYGPARMSPENREAELQRWKDRLPGLADETLLDVGSY